MADTTDYTKMTLSLKVRKVLRYGRIYGPGRTWIKIRGKYHLKNRKIMPKLSGSVSSGSVGIIGCGDFAYTTIAYFLYKKYGPVIRGVTDIDPARASSLCRAYRVGYYTETAEELINDPAIKIIYIASNHASHANYAVKCLEAGKSVHIEKPHVVNEDQLKLLCEAMSNFPGKVFLGFNRPKSQFGRAIKDALQSQSGPSVMNWFMVGQPIAPDHWYCGSEEGGRVLGNLCHWTDFVCQMVEPERRYPILINPTRHVRPDCDIAVTFVFSDGSIAAITFSSLGEVFEGVREIFSAQRGDILVFMRSFELLEIEHGHNKQRWKPWFRDHGHEHNILSSYEKTMNPSQPGEDLSYVFETAELFLKTREALEKNQQVEVYGFRKSIESARVTFLAKN